MQMSSKDENISYFVTFCVEQYKNAKCLKGEEALSLFDRYGVLDFLAENYEVLHTQSYQWILEEIDEFINLRQKEHDTLPR
jgi:hypothetical protein